ncbi:pilus assembly protein [Microvirga pakistanensis]|uniref:pilus assembly protein n=1 Tax=Microvirga pakistanensis TaxID=1682650 RepID=UPI00106B93DF|nr:pilus assembly protein [Microvirga pakistanensis]
MSARKSSNAKIPLITCAGLLPMLALGACADYVKHRDTITSAAGDAQAHNMVVHIDDPWPRSSGNTRITGNGQQVDRVTKRYLSGPAAAPTQSISIGVQGPNSAGSPPAQ